MITQDAHPQSMQLARIRGVLATPAHFASSNVVRSVRVHYPGALISA
jgi:hypothetical protein